MAEVKVEIGGRTFEVACRSGEEHFLKSAAAMLNNEASALNDALGRMPESRMLLMAGLMLADKTASLEDQLKQSPEVAGGGGAAMLKRAKRAEEQLTKVQTALGEAKTKLVETQSAATSAKAKFAKAQIAADAAKTKAAGQLEALQTSYKEAIVSMGNMVKKVEGVAAKLNK